jgi:RNA recognition motif-containing protein
MFFLTPLRFLCNERSKIIIDNSKMEIYVGNLPWSTSDQDLSDAFGAFGKVEKASIISDRNSGRSKGFGFVTMEDADEANKAIESMNGSEMAGRNLKVNEARPREDRPPRQSNW